MVICAEFDCVNLYMPSLKKNIIANYAGQIWTAFMMIAFIPYYLKILGPESFGLVGIMLSLQAISQLFDFGLGGAANRELARRSALPGNAASISTLIRTLEWVVWPMSIFVGMLIFFSSEGLTTHWLNEQTLGHLQVVKSLMLIGFVVAMLWPSNFYLNCLSGLEQQPLLNFVTAIFATLRNAGVLLVLYYISPTITAFLWWNAGVAAIQSLLLAMIVWKKLPETVEITKFSTKELKHVLKFSSGVFLISLLALVLTQIDRFLLAKLQPLTELGYYTVAVSVSAGVGRMIQPMFNAIYPRFSRLVARGDSNSLECLYHSSSQFSSVVLSSFSAILIVFSEQILFLWTGDQVVVSKLKFVLPMLLLSTTLNGFVNIPYALQLANGWTGLGIGYNSIGLLLGVPFCFFAVQHFGMIGAASLGLLLNLSYIFIEVPLMHCRLLKGQWLLWFFSDTLPPLFAAFAMAIVTYAMFSGVDRSIIGALKLILISILVIFSASLASQVVRNSAKDWLLCNK